MIHPPCFVPEDLSFKEIGQSYKFKIKDDLVYHASNGRYYTVPAGFETDWLSVPRIFWPICPPYGKGRKAAALHDYMVSHGHPWNDAAKVFREALEVCGEKPWRIAVMYRAVLWHGKFRKD